MKKYCFALFGVVALLAGCEKDQTITRDQLIERKDFVLTRSDLDFIQENNGFALDLFKRVAAKEKGKSTLISPLSVTIDFGMVNNGAVGETRDEINRVLGYKEGSVDGLNAFCRSMLVQSAEVDPSTTIEFANAAVVNKNLVPLKDSFTKTIQKTYDAEVVYKRFGKDDVKGLINKWCSEKTHGMIKALLEKQPDVDEYAHFLNAVYFKGIWFNKFDKNNTKTESFTREDGSQTHVKMMWQKKELSYGRIPGICGTLALPYGNGAYRMLILLPDKGKTVEDVKEALNTETWNQMIKSFDRYDVDVKIPVFETETDLLHLREALIDMGIQKAFSTNLADFSGMADLKPYEILYIDDVLHKARIKVDENGTEAAAVTSIVIGYGSAALAPPKEIEFHCDRPFLYAITEISSGAIFFIGQYTGK